MDYFCLMKLVADCGSTKIQWALADGATNPEIWTAPGFNPALLSGNDLSAALSSSIPEELRHSAPEEIHFFGAGVIGEREKEAVRSALCSFWPHALVTAASDILGAAVALHGNAPGIACILGTGSAAALYNGSQITGATPSLGFILGDEGSGADIGKHLLNRALKGLLSPSLAGRFMEDNALSVPAAIKKVYRSPVPNRYLASLARWAAENISEPEIEALVRDRFAAFIRANILPLPATDSLPVGFVGSIAHTFSSILTEECAAQGLPAPTILKSPIISLSNYFSHEK